MYDKILKQLETTLKNGITGNELSSVLDAVIKIKTIQALDTSAELIAASRRVSRN